MLAYEGMELLDVAGPVNVLTAASRIARGRRGYDVVLAAARPGPVITDGGIALHATRAIGTLRSSFDTLLVPGSIDSLGRGHSLLPAVKRLAPKARRVVGVCSGAFLLAEAGMLKGRRAVTHWAGCAALRARHPDVAVEDDAIYLRDGKVWTSAGVTAGMDLALALVEQDLGAKTALDVARWLVMYLRRPGGQSQFSAPLRAQASGEPLVISLAAWARANLTADLSVKALAVRASMSERNFARIFTQHAGVTPAAWVASLRLEAARAALELTEDSVKHIAALVGYEAPETMHRAFARSLGTTPLAYRARFRIA